MSFSFSVHDLERGFLREDFDMTTYYEPVELSDVERDVLAAATAIVACESLPTRDAIASFLEMPTSQVSSAIRVLKHHQLIKQRRTK